MPKRVFIIAELCSNPAPDWHFAKWCEAAMEARADAVKVQVFKAEHFPAPHDVAKRPLEFPRERLPEFARTARAYGLVPGASVFDEEASNLTARACGFLKLAAREAENEPLIQHTRNMAERHNRWLYRTVPTLKPDKHWDLPRTTTLHTIAEYPAGMMASLLAVTRAAMAFRQRGMRWGWSSHTAAPGWLDCIWAARLGAEVIEKHFCLSHADIEGQHSLTPEEFGALVARVRDV